MAHETETLAGYVAELKFEDIPPEVLERAKVLTLDFLGSAIRARRDVFRCCHCRPRSSSTPAAGSSTAPRVSRKPMTCDRR